MLLTTRRRNMQKCKTLSAAIYCFLQAWCVQKLSRSIPAHLNPQALWDLLKAKYPKLITHGCTAHVLDLYMKKIGSLVAIKLQLDRANEIVIYLRTHSRANSLFSHARGEKAGLVNVVVTRFGTWALMLISLVKNR